MRDHKESWASETDVFELWCGRRLLRVPWTERRSNQSIIYEINPEYSLEGLILKLKLQYFGHLIWRTDSLKKTPGAGKDWRQEGKRMPGDEIVGWHHWLDGCESEQAPGVDDWQGSLAATVYGVTKSWTQMSGWTELMVKPRLVETKWLYRVVLGEIIVDRYKLQTLLTTKL